MVRRRLRSHAGVSLRRGRARLARGGRAACEPAGPPVYPLLKDACDKYFYLPHRGETRGVGGLFADDLNDARRSIGGDFEHCFALIRRIGDAYLEAYVKLVTRRRDTPYGEREQAFQRLRRGRYVEFNLAFDRGTRFGLQSSARTESLLMSLPPRAEWRYDYRPEPGSPEARLADYLKPREWLDDARDVMKYGVLLVNSGTPASLATRDVRAFLAGLLGDPRVVELPRWLWLAHPARHHPAGAAARQREEIRRHLDARRIAAVDLQRRIAHRAGSSRCAPATLRWRWRMLYTGGATRARPPSTRCAPRVPSTSS